MLDITHTHTHTRTHTRGANVAQRTGTWVGMDGVGCGAGSTALHLAAGGGHLPVVKILVSGFILPFGSNYIFPFRTGIAFDHFKFYAIYFLCILCSLFSQILATIG